MSDTLTDYISIIILILQQEQLIHCNSLEKFHLNENEENSILGLLGAIEHIGSQLTYGHYVSYFKKKNKWYQLNFFDYLYTKILKEILKTELLQKNDQMLKGIKTPLKKKKKVFNDKC